MIAYHGSNSNFKRFKISKSLCNKVSTALNEGYGIYFTTDIETARSYGKYLYTIEINNKYLIDFRKRENCIRYIKGVQQYTYDKFGVDIGHYIDLGTLTNNMCLGGLTICTICNEINQLLDNLENWHTGVCQSKRQAIESMLRTYDKKRLTAYMFNYSIKNTGVIKKIDDDIVRIVNKSFSY